ncbi:MAG: hypothetical protein CSA75_01370, partial [Sorangium cellulosum]
MHALLELWPALAAGAFGAFLPKRPSWTERAGVGVLAALLVAFLILIWPDAAARTEAAPSEWPHLLNLLIGLPMVGAFFILYFDSQPLSKDMVPSQEETRFLLFDNGV